MIANNWIDYSIIGVIALSLLTGLFRGFIKEVVSLCVWALAIWLSMTYASRFEPMAMPYIHDNHARIFIVFVIILLAVLLVGALINALLSFILRNTGLTISDRILGMGFGFLRGVFIVSLLMLIAKMVDLPKEDIKKESKLYAKFEPIVDWLSGYTPQLIEKIKVLEPNKN